MPATSLNTSLVPPPSMVMVMLLLWLQVPVKPVQSIEPTVVETLRTAVTTPLSALK